MRTLLRVLFIGVVALSCFPNGKLKTNYDVVPQQLGDGWQIATPAEAGLDTAKVMEAYRMLWDENAYYNAKSLLIIRHGKLVFENYCRDANDREIIAHIQSATKSVTSLVFGICRDQGFFPNLDTTLYALMPDKFPDDSLKWKITLRHLLTMKSGIRFDNDQYSDEVLAKNPQDIVRYILAKPMCAAPGDLFYYRDCDPQLLSSTVQRVTGKTLVEIAREELFEPMGITNFVWDPNHDGSSQGGHGLFLRPRDLAKFGQLALQKGNWDGRQLVSEDWMTQSTAAQTESLPGEGPDDVRYGFYWWVLPKQDLFTAYGHGGQYVCVLPELDMIVVMTSMPSTNDDNVGTILPEFMPLVYKIRDAATP
jgi:CubicO group peptidase (beta-lactamase class C family)